MPAQLRAYITPEEYESAFAMSNKLKQDDSDREQKMMAFMFGSLCLCPLVAVYKILVIDCQRNEDRFGEPFKQWEKNGLKVNFSLGQGGGKQSVGTPNVLRIHFPTS